MATTRGGRRVVGGGTTTRGGGRVVGGGGSFYDGRSQVGIGSFYDGHSRSWRWKVIILRRPHFSHCCA